MNLYFDGVAVTVPTKAIISRALIAKAKPHLETLRNLGVNAAFLRELRKSPNAARVITQAGGINTEWAAEQRAIILEAYPGMNPESVDQMVTQRTQAKLIEEFPQIWEVLNNPVTSFNLDNEDALRAGIDLLRVILDTGALTEQQRERIDTDEFWDEQDLEEVTATVESFRARVERRAA